MRDLLIALYSRPGLLPIAGMTLAGVVVIGWTWSGWPQGDGP